MARSCRKAVIVLLGSSLLEACGTEPPVRPHLEEYNLGQGNLALRGYSPVSYLDEGIARLGSPELTVTHRGITYHLASHDEVSRFQADPDRYEPQCGGWCTYGAAVGVLWDVDPENFQILHGRLFLFSRNDDADALELWRQEKDKESLIERATTYWASILAEGGSPG